MIRFEEMPRTQKWNKNFKNTVDCGMTDMDYIGNGYARGLGQKVLANLPKKFPMHSLVMALFIVCVGLPQWVSALKPEQPEHRASDNMEIKTFPEQLTRIQLANGLKIIVKEDPLSPTVMFMTAFNVGSMDEEEGKTGLAHVLEHMMFKQTKNLKVGDFDKSVKALGGQTNAFTNTDMTAYYIAAPKESIEKIMELESERMQNLQVTEEDFAKEIEVIKEERRMRTDDNPNGLLYEKLMHTVFKVHPYRNPVIGWRKDLDRLSAKDAQQWYDRWYTPENATIIVVGGVGVNQLLPLIKKYYAPIAAKGLPNRPKIEEPIQQTTQVVTHRDYAENEIMHLIYRVPRYEPGKDNTDVMALDLLSTILSGYKGARLTKKLQDQQKIALSVASSYGPTSRGPGLFRFSGMPAPEYSSTNLQQAIQKEIKDIQLHGVTEKEVKRAIAQYRASRVYARDSKMSQALELYDAEISGIGVNKIDDYFKTLEKIKPLDIQRVAGKYISANAPFTKGVLIPDKTVKRHSTNEMISPMRFR